MHVDAHIYTHKGKSQHPLMAYMFLIYNATSVPIHTHIHMHPLEHIPVQVLMRVTQVIPMLMRLHTHARSH